MSDITFHTGKYTKRDFAVIDRAKDCASHAWGFFEVQLLDCVC